MFYIGGQLLAYTSYNRIQKQNHYRKQPEQLHTRQKIETNTPKRDITITDRITVCNTSIS
jgi:hypothetical protein